MIQAKFSLRESHLLLLEECKQYGFKDKSALVRAALDHLSAELKRQRLRNSAALLAELYNEDEETREWTNATLSEWPE
jgi:hypothetical protein